MDAIRAMRGQSFVHTNSGLAGKEGEMLEDLEGIRGYLKSVDRFKELFMLSAYIGGGAPARGDELRGLRWVNGINRDRGVFIINGEMVTVTQYHKSLAHFDAPKVIPRFLPPRVAQLMAIYFVYIRPLTNRWEVEQWALITLQDWRHITIAVSKKHARQRGAAKADFEEDDNDDDNEAEQYEIPDDLAAAHTTKTAANYGVTIDVSYRWHKFLELNQPSSGPPPPLPLKREAEADIKPQAPRPLKRARVMYLEKPRLSSGRDQVILKALQAETPLVAILPTGGGKSLIFIMPAILAGAGVTIVVAPYAELKKQLVTRCLDAGIDCKHWPQACDSWPRVVIVSAEAATGDDFIQWAADLSVRGRLDRVVIDECHLTFTAAYEYRKKLQRLVRLRSLGCPFRDFKEAMQLQHPLYIRALSHRTNAHYSVLRVRNRRGPMEVKKLVKARVGLLAPGEKGVVYCMSYRESGFQAWLRGETPIIDYAQEASYAGRAGERVAAVIVVEEKDWLSEDLRIDGRFEMKVREVNSLIRIKGCRRRILGQCLDNDIRDCDRIDDAVPELSTQGIIISAAYGRKAACGLE
ncbi:P-loop containing nucleoside triphosphate hydrolase protein [Trichoderma pleuroticola]